jgi:hypothetical protein
MSKELEGIETIERYLMGGMSEVENADFEKKLAEDEVLKSQVVLQRELIEAIRHKTLQEKVNKAAKNHFFLQALKKWLFMGGISLAILGAAVYVYLHRESHHAQRTIDSKQGYFEQENHASEDSSSHTLESDNKRARENPLPTQQFAVWNERDTVIETKSGLLFAIPAGSAMNSDNQAVKGKVVYSIKEALKASDILLAGLDTRSGGKLLETGGMFSISASQKGNTLQLHPQKRILVQVPSPSAKPGMQLFDGKPKADGTLDWVNPKPLENFLVPVDILSLDFYPPNYLDLLASDVSTSQYNKSFADSLYYSFSSDSRAGRVWVDPAAIKTIWNRRFNNTLLATKEFEERLKYIHKSCSGAVLDLYVKNLDKNLYELDSMAAQRLDGELKTQFETFAKQRKGKVAGNNPNAQLLAGYYSKRSMAYKMAIKKTVESYNQKREKLEKEINDIRQSNVNKNVDRKAINFEEELEINKRHVYKELGLNPDAPLPVATTEVVVYTGVVEDFGWKNIDQLVAVTLSRTSSTFKLNGKTAQLTYENLELKLEDQGNEETFVYLLPKQLYSFMRVAKNGDMYSESLNSLLEYDLICIGFKDDQRFVYVEKKVKAGKVRTIKLLPTSGAELKTILAQYETKKRIDLEGEVSNQLHLISLERQKKKMEADEESIELLKDHLFHCGEVAEEYYRSGDKLQSVPESREAIELAKPLKRIDD